MPSAADLTDKKLTQMEKHLHGIYTRAEKEVGESWKNYLAKTDEQLKTLREEYEAAKRSGDKKEIKKTGKALGQAKRDKTLRDNHYKALTEQLSLEITAINQQAIAYINGNLPAVYALNYNEVATQVSTAAKGYSFELVDAHTVKNLATKNKTLLPYKKVNERKDVRWNTRKVNSEVLQGILQGESIDKIAGRLSNVLNMNETSAMRNARTSVTSAQNKGRMDMLHDAADKGITVQKVWIAVIDNHTRDSHRDDLNGETVDMDEAFSNGLQYPGDPDGEPAEVYNCRCRISYKIAGVRDVDTGEWIDLDFDGG